MYLVGWQSTIRGGLGASTLGGLWQIGRCRWGSWSPCQPVAGSYEWWGSGSAGQWLWESAGTTTCLPYGTPTWPGVSTCVSQLLAHYQMSPPWKSIIHFRQLQIIVLLLCESYYFSDNGRLTYCWSSLTLMYVCMCISDYWSIRSLVCTCNFVSFRCQAVCMVKQWCVCMYLCTGAIGHWWGWLGEWVAHTKKTIDKQCWCIVAWSTEHWYMCFSSYVTQGTGGLGHSSVDEAYNFYATRNPLDDIAPGMPPSPCRNTVLYLIWLLKGSH